ncbi:hypothetical protein BDP67DRAFT_216868 [Colletotrichum lupini]|nr:hypothetical protein BDP67DRAFT_216868 [Colletotrichum lupini]
MEWESKRGSRRGPRFLPRVPGSGWLLIGRVGGRKRISRKGPREPALGPSLLPSLHRKTTRPQIAHLMIRGKGANVTAWILSDATPRWGEIAGDAGDVQRHDFPHPSASDPLSVSLSLSLCHSPPHMVGNKNWIPRFPLGPRYKVSKRRYHTLPGSHSAGHSLRQSEHNTPRLAGPSSPPRRWLEPARWFLLCPGGKAYTHAVARRGAARERGRGRVQILLAWSLPLQPCAMWCV